MLLDILEILSLHLLELLVLALDLTVAELLTCTHHELTWPDTHLTLCLHCCGCCIIHNLSLVRHRLILLLVR